MINTPLIPLYAQMVKNPPAIRETWVQSLDWEDPLEEGMATHSSILAWRIPMDRGAWWATVNGVPKSRTRLSTAQHPSGSASKQPTCQCRRHKRHGFDPWIGKIPWRRAWQPTPVFLPGKFLDRGGWRATVYGVAKSSGRLSS